METAVVFNNIKLPINASFQEAFSVAMARMRALRMSTRDRKFSIYRRSVDARHRDRITLVYSVAAELHPGETPPHNLADKDGALIVKASPEIIRGTTRLSSRPVIIGS